LNAILKKVESVLGEKSLDTEVEGEDASAAGPTKIAWSDKLS